MLLLNAVLFFVLPLFVFAHNTSPSPIILTSFDYFGNATYNTKWNSTSDAPKCFDIIMVNPNFPTVSLAEGVDTSCGELTSNIQNIFGPGYSRFRRQEVQQRDNNQIVYVSSVSDPNPQSFSTGPAFTIKSSDFITPA